MNKTQAHEIALAYAQSSFSQLSTGVSSFSITNAEKRADKNVTFFLDSYNLAYNKVVDQNETTKEETENFLNNALDMMS